MFKMDHETKKQYFKRLRGDLLERLNLPPDTPPERVREILEERERLKAAQREGDIRVNWFKAVRKKILQNLRLPEDVPPENTEEWLKIREKVDRIDAIFRRHDQKKK